MKCTYSERWGEEPLFPYQERTIEFLTHGKSGLIKDRMSGTTIQVVASSAGRGVCDIDPGLGKSRIAIGAYVELCAGEKLLVACSKKALNTWRRELPKWTTLTSDDVTIVEGSPAVRAALWKKPSIVKVITFQSGMRDEAAIKAFGPTMIIGDEIKLMRNRKTQAFKFWAPIMHKVKYVIPMDGTLVSKGPEDLWTFLNIIKPKTFNSFWKYANAFCLIVDGPFGKEFCGPKNTQGLANMLSHNLVRIRDNDPQVQGQRPPLLRDFKLVDLTGEQAKIYDELVNDLLLMTPGGDIVATPSQLALTVRLRQLLICPKILDPAYGIGGAVEQLLLELEDDPHSVIFTPFTKAIPHIREAMVKAGHDEPFVLQGGTASAVVGDVEKAFNSSAGSSRSCICSIGFAESFELYTAKQGHFIGYEWAQRLNYQAEKRLHRLITPHPVNIWYYRYVGTTDDDILDNLNDRQHKVNLTFQDYIAAIRRLRNKD